MTVSIPFIALEIASDKLCSCSKIILISLLYDTFVFIISISCLHTSGKGFVENNTLTNQEPSIAKTSKVLSPPSLKPSHTEEMPKMRRLIADHMRASLDTSAHVYLMTEVDMTKIVNFVKAFNITDIVTMAVPPGLRAEQMAPSLERLFNAVAPRAKAELARDS